MPPISEPFSKQSKATPRSCSALATVTPEEPAPIMQISGPGWTFRAACCARSGASRRSMLLSGVMGKVVVDDAVEAGIGPYPKTGSGVGDEIGWPTGDDGLQLPIGFVMDASKSAAIGILDQGLGHFGDAYCQGRQVHRTMVRKVG